MFKQDTIAAVATPPGEGGIAIIRVSGPQARTIAARIFRPRHPGNPERYDGFTVHYGRFAAPESREAADDGLLTMFQGPHSYTGEDTIELSCHGGRVTTAHVLQLALQAGARLAEPGEFTLRAFLNGRLDLAQAEAVADVIRARTETARRMARRQLEGALSQTVIGLKDKLIGILAAIEVTIDFSEEVGELEYGPLEARITQVREDVERLLATSERGRILREGLRITIVGRPNVGKSSLLNALLRAERAIVTPVAGTTRDIVEESAVLGSLPVVLVDTAGIRETEDVVERIGVQRAQASVGGSDMTLLVVDAFAGWTPEDETVLDQVREEAAHLLLVFNKSDLLTPEEADCLRAALSARTADFAAPVFVSAQTGAGLDTLETTLIESIRGGEKADEEVDGDGDGTGTVLVSNARHRQALEAALRSLQEAERTFRLRLPGDFIAIDTRGALDALGQITGETVTEEIIHRIFHDFCVGK